MSQALTREIVFKILIFLYLKIFIDRNETVVDKILTRRWRA